MIAHELDARQPGLAQVRLVFANFVVVSEFILGGAERPLARQVEDRVRQRALARGREQLRKIAHKPTGAAYYKDRATQFQLAGTVADGTICTEWKDLAALYAQ